MYPVVTSAVVATQPRGLKSVSEPLTALQHWQIFRSKTDGFMFEFLKEGELSSKN